MKKSTKEFIERIEGLSNMKFIPALEQQIKEWLDEGFDGYDIQQYLATKIFLITQDLKDEKLKILKNPNSLPDIKIP